MVKIPNPVLERTGFVDCSPTAGRVVSRVDCDLRTMSVLEDLVASVGDLIQELDAKNLIIEENRRRIRLLEDVNDNLQRKLDSRSSIEQESVIDCPRSPNLINDDLMKSIEGNLSRMNNSLQKLMLTRQSEDTFRSILEAKWTIRQMMDVILLHERRQTSANIS